MPHDDSILPAPVAFAADGLTPIEAPRPRRPDEPAAPADEAHPPARRTRAGRRGRRTRPVEAAPPDRPREQPHAGRSITDILHKIIDAAKRLSRRELAQVLAGVLLIVGMIVVLPKIDTVEPLGIVLYAVVCASLIIVLVKEEAVKKALIVMGIAAAGILIAQLAPSISRLLDTRISAQSLPKPAAQWRPVYGTVVDEARHPLAHVFVRARGNTPVETDAAGRFSLSVLENTIRDDVVELHLIRGQQVDTVRQVLGDGEVTVVFGGGTVAQPPAPSVAARAQNALLASSGAPTRPGNAAVAVIVDSIYTVFDGSWVGPARWTFDVSVLDGTPIRIRKATYDNEVAEPLRTMVVGSETGVPLTGDTLAVTVRGMRDVLPILRYRLKGSLTLHADEIPADRPLRRVIEAKDGAKWNNGHFRFYITILKLPTPPQPG